MNWPSIEIDISLLDTDQTKGLQIGTQIRLCSLWRRGMQTLSSRSFSTLTHLIISMEKGGVLSGLGRGQGNENLRYSTEGGGRSLSVGLKEARHANCSWDNCYAYAQNPWKSCYCPKTDKPFLYCLKTVHFRCYFTCHFPHNVMRATSHLPWYN